MLQQLPSFSRILRNEVWPKYAFYTMSADMLMVIQYAETTERKNGRIHA